MQFDETRCDPVTRNAEAPRLVLNVHILVWSGCAIFWLALFFAVFAGG